MQFVAKDAGNGLFMIYKLGSRSNRRKRRPEMIMPTKPYRDALRQLAGALPDRNAMAQSRPPMPLLLRPLKRDLDQAADRLRARQRLALPGQPVINGGQLVGRQPDSDLRRADTKQGSVG